MSGVFRISREAVRLAFNIVTCPKYLGYGTAAMIDTVARAMFNVLSRIFQTEYLENDEADFQGRQIDAIRARQTQESSEEEESRHASGDSLDSKSNVNSAGMQKKTAKEEKNEVDEKNESASTTVAHSTTISVEVDEKNESASTTVAHSTTTATSSSTPVVSDIAEVAGCAPFEPNIKSSSTAEKPSEKTTVKTDRTVVSKLNNSKRSAPPASHSFSQSFVAPSSAPSLNATMEILSQNLSASFQNVEQAAAVGEDSAAKSPQEKQSIEEFFQQDLKHLSQSLFDKRITAGFPLGFASLVKEVAGWEEPKKTELGGSLQKWYTETLALPSWPGEGEARKEQDKKFFDLMLKIFPGKRDKHRELFSNFHLSTRNAFVAFRDQKDPQSAPTRPKSNSNSPAKSEQIVTPKSTPATPMHPSARGKPNGSHKKTQGKK